MVSAWTSCRRRARSVPSRVIGLVVSWVIEVKECPLSDVVGQSVDLGERWQICSVRFVTSEESRRGQHVCIAPLLFRISQHDIAMSTASKQKIDK